MSHDFIGRSSYFTETFTKRKTPKLEGVIRAAFKTDVENEAFLFTKTKYVKVDYAPCSNNDKVLYGPAPIRELRSLRNTVFEDGIDCAFGSHYKGQAYIFAGNMVARWVYPSNTSFDMIIQGPVPISKMFPFLKGTVYENGVDAAFESTTKYEAFLFVGNAYALINYGPINPGLIANYCPLLKYCEPFVLTPFKDGCFDAAFASHRQGEAYMFKDEGYTRLKFSPGGSIVKLLHGFDWIKGNWPSLETILPRTYTRPKFSPRGSIVNDIIANHLF